VDILPKNKDITRWRPLVSYYNNFSKRAGKLIARALTVIIKTLEGIWNTMNISTTNEVKPIINKLNKSEKWKNLCKQNNITLIAFDIKEQFTNLCKSEVIDGIKAGLKKIRKTFRTHYVSVAKRKIDRYRDKIGEKGNDFHIFTFKDILQYVEYELKTSIFKYGDKYISQKNGLPMSGFLSASLVQIDSMYKEHISYQIWKHKNYPTKWIRFRDDGRGIIGKQLSEPEINEIQTILGKIYGKNLTVIIEDWSYQEVTFLDARIIKNPLKFKFELRHYNKNIDLRKDNPKNTTTKIIRFPEIQSGWCSHIFRGCMIGAIRRVQRTCNTDESFLLGVTFTGL
jgi:hypothetical protein